MYYTGSRVCSHSGNKFHYTTGIWRKFNRALATAHLPTLAKVFQDEGFSISILERESEREREREGDESSSIFKNFDFLK